MGRNYSSDKQPELSSVAIELEWSERLRRVVKEFAGGNQAELAGKIGRSPQAVSKLLAGGVPSGDTVEAVLRAYPRLNPDWLLLGRGPMVRDTAPALAPATAEELDLLAQTLDEARAVVKEMRARYGTTPPPAGVDVEELWEAIQQLEGEAREELRRRAAEPPPQAQAN